MAGFKCFNSTHLFQLGKILSANLYSSNVVVYDIQHVVLITGIFCLHLVDYFFIRVVYILVVYFFFIYIYYVLVNLLRDFFFTW